MYTHTNMQTFVKAHHKVGVLRVKEGQRSEEEIFANNQEPGCFEEFLNVLGKEGWYHHRNLFVAVEHTHLNAVSCFSFLVLQ